MERIRANSARAGQGYRLVCDLQQRFVDKLNAISRQYGKGTPYAPTEWFRDQGRHGGGVRFMAMDEAVFNRASVNTSQVHYDDEATKQLGSASAISTIIHPQNPLAPSVHIHISWTEMKKGGGYWRMMADLNPSNEYAEDREKFASRLRQAAPQQYAEAARQGDRYFNIPVLGRTRGVTHFYLENYTTGNFDADLALAKSVGEAAIDTYCEILSHALATRTAPAEANYRQQLAYHTLYFFQVLTLDRGTTSGLLVHDQNDIGIMASLPSHVDRNLLVSWIPKMPSPQDQLLQKLIDCLPNEAVCAVDDAVKQALANSVRKHYMAHPEAIDMQASGNTKPPTVDNHLKKVA